MAKQRSHTDSQLGAVSLFQGAIRDVHVPDGLELRPEEEIIWRQFSRARIAGDWKEMDLVLLWKTVRLEADMRRHQATLDREGVIVENARGTQIENPLLRVIDLLQRQQMSIIRSMSLTTNYSDPRVLNAHGKKAAQARNTQEGSAMSLLASPE